LSSHNRTFNGNTGVTGYDGDTLSGTANATIDMSANFASYMTVGGLPPKSWELGIQVQDSGSAAAGLNRFRLAKDNTINTNRRTWIGLEGVPNNIKRGLVDFIPADDNGDIYADWAATGANTMTVFIAVRRMNF
jgi:hypothetical protein